MFKKKSSVQTNMRGQFELILGGMFGGKTSELLFRMNKYSFQGENVKLFSPEIDTRYSKNEIITHDGLKRECVKIKNTYKILDYLDDETSIVGIDEGQMMDENLPEVVDILTTAGKLVIVSALPYDFRTNFFPFRKIGDIEKDSERNMSELIKRTAYITWKPAYCMEEMDGKMCCKDTFLGQRYLADGTIAPKEDLTIKLGTSDSNEFERSYKSKCWKHFKKY